MKALLDTSVLVAALLERHPNHLPALSWIQAIHQQRVEGTISAHSLAELYATLSAMPASPRLTTSEIEQLIQTNVVSHFSVRSVNARRYVALVRRMAEAGHRSGVIYDAIHAEVARQTKVDRLVTLNPRHFHRVWDGDPTAIVTPSELSPT